MSIPAAGSSTRSERCNAAPPSVKSAAT
jgi:hypothetical protein